MGVVLGASLLAGLLAVVAGWMGSHHYLGFTILSRAFVSQLSGKGTHGFADSPMQILGYARRFLACVE